MLGMVGSQIRRRGGRTVALFLAILIAASGFTVLTASSSANRLQTVGTVQAHARTVYDILVRPKGSRTHLETSQGLVQPGFLTGVYGGISLDQWKQIKGLPGIEVAAPIAMVGYVVLPLQMSVDMRPALPTTGDGVARMDVTWSFDNGLSTLIQPPDFAYLTKERLVFNEGGPAPEGFYRRLDHGPGAATICPGNLDVEPGAPLTARQSTLRCFSRTQGGEDETVTWPAGLVGQRLDFPLPVVLAAVDPAQEDKLDGLDQAVTSGRSLQGAPLKDGRTMSGEAVPVLAGEAPATGITAHVTLSRVAGNATALVQDNQQANSLRNQPHETVQQKAISAAQAYRTLLANLENPQPDKRSRGDDGLAGNVYWYATVSGPMYGIDGARLVPSGPASYVTGTFRAVDPFSVPGADDVHVRTVGETATFGDNGQFPTPATLIARGRFDPAKLSGLTDLTAQILSGYATAPPLALMRGQSSCWVVRVWRRRRTSVAWSSLGR